MIEVDDVCFAYPGGALALDHVSVRTAADQAFAVLGESGSGKTTLLRCIGGFLRPQSGTIRIDGDDIATLGEQALRARLGIVFQRLHLFPHLDVVQNMVLAPRLVQGADADSARRQALDMLERLGIAELATSYPSQISGGQAQRVAIARGLMLAPRYMLLDEPTAALDANTTDAFAAWLRELRDQTCFIIVTHDTLFAAQVADQGVYLSGGLIADSGDIQTMIEHVRRGGLEEAPAG